MSRPQWAATAIISTVLLLLSGCSLPVDLHEAVMSGTAAGEVMALSSTPEAPGKNIDVGSSAVSSVPNLTLEEAELLLQLVDELNVAIYRQVSPSVVHITSRVITMDFWGGWRPSEGTGSGFVLDRDGHIVTNYHVIEGAQAIEVVLLDDTIAEAQVVGVDPLNDLAVLRVDVARDQLHPIALAPSTELHVGQRAIAIGNPFGLDWTMTTGVISSVGRPLELSDRRVIYDVVQTDAAINPGNSGGPLLNSRGELIGVNTAMRQGAENLGFAIPLSTVQRVVPELIANGKYRHPWLGIVGYSISQELAQRLDLPVDHGILIAGVYDGSAADKAGLRGGSREVIVGNSKLWLGGDILVAVDGVAIDDNASLYEYLETGTRVGQQVLLTYYRGDQQASAQATLQERQR